MTYTAAQMMEVAIQEIGRMLTMKVCKTCTRKEGDDWLLPNAEAKHHQDRYPSHVIVDVDKNEQKKGAGK